MNTIRGTLAQLDGKISINGRNLTMPQLSILTTLGVGRKVGEMPKASASTRGRAASIWEFDQDHTLTFTSNE